MAQLDELYDLSNGAGKAIPLEDWCNQIIHSFIFIPSFDDHTRQLDGLFVSSGRQKPKGLFYVRVDEILALAQAVAKDEIVYMSSRRAAVGEPMEVVVKSSKQPKRDGK